MLSCTLARNSRQLKYIVSNKCQRYRPYAVGVCLLDYCSDRTLI
uniref:Uncharacterized protein n=1 Tax=Anguilla anguilla TaxID=7936 RepID=A0A0E9T2B0_ANGAN